MHRIVICLMCKCFSEEKTPKDLVTLKELHKNNHKFHLFQNIAKHFLLIQKIVVLFQFKLPDLS
jgi:hypothetical protein